MTVAFHHTDDLKTSVDMAQASELQYGGRTLRELYSQCDGLYPESVFPDMDQPQASLWTAKLFTSHVDMGQSFSQTLGLVKKLLNDNKINGEVQGKETIVKNGECKLPIEDESLNSMQDIGRLKDVEAVLEFRKLHNQLCPRY